MNKAILSVLLSTLCPIKAQIWTPQTSNTTASLRGVSVVNAKVVWASGSKGTFLITTDGGATWKPGTVQGAADMDFRAVRAFDDKTAILMSIGSGEKSRIYKTKDGGGTWEAVYTNPDPKGFFDAIAFWDATHGILLGDPVDGHFLVMTTDDGGDSWKREKTPAAQPNEGAFAASNSCMFLIGLHEVWFGTGGARVFHSIDGGKKWTVSQTPIRHDVPSAGIFSVAFLNPLRGIAVGGDYSKPADPAHNIAITEDGGKKWTAPEGSPTGFRSAVTYLPDRKMWIATGTSGSDASIDKGKTWKQFDKGDYNAMSFLLSYAGWAVGPKGAIARFSVE
ncbi:MAG TPA: YCF48-related protein [Bryobacteraceae bacterium]|nr:YCF48-related protein [Bryobacteraceae bacterium]